MKQKRFFYALHFPIILQMELDFGRGYCKKRARLYIYTEIQSEKTVVIFVSPHWV